MGASRLKSKADSKLHEIFSKHNSVNFFDMQIDKRDLSDEEDEQNDFEESSGDDQDIK